jgi:hypothetical protein
MAEFKKDDFIRNEETGREGFVLEVLDDGTYKVDFLTDPSPDYTDGSGFVVAEYVPDQVLEGEEYVPDCETCGEPIDYCQGHGVLG